MALMVANWRDRGNSKTFSSTNSSPIIYIQKLSVWYKHYTHLGHPFIKVLIDERIDCLPTPRRLGAVLLTSTNLFPFFAQLGQSIQLYCHSCLPFHVFERNNYRGTHLGFTTHHLLGGHMAIYLHGRRPTGVTERLLVVGRCWIERGVISSLWLAFYRHSQVMPNPLSFTTMEPSSISSRTCVFARLWAGIRRKRKNPLVGDGLLGIVRALLYSHNLRKERKGNEFPPHPMTTHIYVYPGGRRRAGMQIEYRGI